MRDIIKRINNGRRYDLDTVSNVEGSVVEGSQAETDYVLRTSGMQEGSYRFTVRRLEMVWWWLRENIRFH